MARPKNSRVRDFLNRNLLTMLTIAGVVGGTITGCIIRSTQTRWSERDVMYLQFPGDLFLRMLKALIIPLLTSSIISAIGALDLSLSRKIAIRSICYYACTTVCAVVLGIILVVTIRPGVNAAANLRDSNTTTTKYDRDVLTVDTLLDLIRNLFPPNIVQATVGQYRTILVRPINKTTGEVIQGIPLEEYEMKNEYAENTNVLGLVVFSIVFGITLGKMGHKGKPLLDFFQTLSETMMIITQWVIWLSPIGVFFLVTAKLMEISSFGEIVGQLGWYFMTVLAGLFIHGFGTLSILYFICTRTLPFRFIAGMGQVLATAFGTASSSATMPITIQHMDKMGVDGRVSRFVIPIGATINMDGTALYEAVAAIFIAQIRNVSLSFGHIVAVSVTATAASIGAAGIPQAGLVTMVMVLDTVGLPAEDVTLIIAVDWLLDRFRTTINVMCDALGARLVDLLSKGELSKPDDLEMDKVNADPQELVEIAKGAEDTRI